MTFDFNDFLKKVANMNVSDIHLLQNEHPMLRINNKITKINMPQLTKEDMYSICKQILPTSYQDKIEEIYDLDFAMEIPGLSRYRVNLSKSTGCFKIVMRLIPLQIKSLEELMVPKSIEEFTKYNNGLVVVTGATGSGKSTTIAAMLDYINRTTNKHIITLEDPIEFVYTGKKCTISQRQVGIDTPSFNDGIKYALRQDPDIIFIGEIRDSNTITAALNAAETGHLVFATIHTRSAVQTINRVINMFPAESRDFIRCQLANVLVGTISQKLIPTADGKGRLPACEVLVNSSTVKDYIEKNKLDDIYDVMSKGLTSGMSTMNMALYELFSSGRVTRETAEEYSDNPNELLAMMRGVTR